MRPRPTCSPLESRLLFAHGPLTYYVNPATLTGNHAGTSWANAAPDLQAILAAANNGDTIKIAQGTYKPTATSNRAATFNLKSGITLIGSLAGSDDAHPDALGSPTILSGDIGAAAATDNAYHVLTANAVTSVSLSNLQISDGYADNSGPNGSFGAGLLAINNSFISISNCSFSNNTAVDAGPGKGFGGGGFLSADSVAPFNNCTFTANSADSGGAVRTESPHVTFEACSFSSNFAIAFGGALNLLTDGSALTLLSDCSFIANSTGPDGTGGAIFNGDGSHLHVVNSLFVLNTAGSIGGAIQNYFNAQLAVDYSSFSANHVDATGAAISNYSGTLTVNNSILFNDSVSLPGSPEIYDADASASVTFSIVQGGYPGTGNSSVDPKFVAAPIDLAHPGDLHLQIGSPALNTGNPNTYRPTLDYDGRARLRGISPDPGAFEGPADHTPPTSHVIPFPHDSQSSQITISFTGSDNDAIAYYDIYYSTNGGPFSLYDSTLSTSILLNGAPGNQYAFYSVATDINGNVESKPAAAEASLFIDNLAPSSLLLPVPTNAPNAAIPLSWAAFDAIPGTGPITFTLFASTDSGPYTPFLTDTTLAGTTFTATPGHTYRFRVIAKDNAGNAESKSPTLAEATTTYAPPASHVLPFNSDSSYGTFAVAWASTGAIPADSYAIFVSIDSAPYITYLAYTTDTSNTFLGTPGHHYEFYSLATSQGGSTESKPAPTAEASLWVDDAPPTSSVSPLPATSTSATIPLSWSAVDPVPGSGPITYTIFVSDNYSTYTPYLTNTPLTSTTFTATPNHLYRFYSLASDNANREDKFATAEATTTYIVNLPALTQLGTPSAKNNLTIAPSPIAIPKKAVGGTTFSGTVIVKNTGTATGKLAVSFYLSEDGILSTQDLPLNTYSLRSPTTRQPGTSTVPYSIRLPKNLTGNFQLLARVNPPADNGTLPIPETDTLDDTATLAKFNLAPPTFNLTAKSLTKPQVTGQRASTTLTLSNDSNTPFTGSLPITLTLSLAGKTLSTSTLTSKTPIPAGSSLRLTLPFTPPTKKGTYTLTITLDPKNTLHQSNLTDDTRTLTLKITK